CCYFSLSVCISLLYFTTHLTPLFSPTRRFSYLGFKRLTDGADVEPGLWRVRHIVLQVCHSVAFADEDLPISRHQNRPCKQARPGDRKSTRLNYHPLPISYYVFCFSTQKLSNIIP